MNAAELKIRIQALEDARNASCKYCRRAETACKKEYCSATAIVSLIYDAREELDKAILASIECFRCGMPLRTSESATIEGDKRVCLATKACEARQRSIRKATGSKEPYDNRKAFLDGYMRLEMARAGISNATVPAEARLLRDAERAWERYKHVTGFKETV